MNPDYEKLIWTPHALQRAKERFPNIDLDMMFLSAKKVGKKRRAKIRESCPVSWDKWMSNGFKGRYVVITRCNIVFVVLAPNTVVTVFKLGDKSA